MIRVVGEHHQALKEWARYRRTLNAPCTILTFDHHTDTLPAFGRAADGEADRLDRIARFDWRSDESVDRALAGLRHDEHLDLALRGEVAKRCVVVAHADHPGCANEKIQVVCDRSWPEMQLLLNSPELFHPLAEQVFETGFLRPLLEEAQFEPEEGFIFDLDLDYLLTLRALEPTDGTLFRELLARVGLVTVSLEADWVRLLRLDNDVTAEALLEKFRMITAESGIPGLTFAE